MTSKTRFTLICQHDIANPPVCFLPSDPALRTSIPFQLLSEEELRSRGTPAQPFPSSLFFFFFPEAYKTYSTNHLPNDDALTAAKLYTLPIHFSWHRLLFKDLIRLGWRSPHEISIFGHHPVIFRLNISKISKRIIIDRIELRFQFAENLLCRCRALGISKFPVKKINKISPCITRIGFHVKYRRKVVSMLTLLQR